MKLIINSPTTATVRISFRESRLIRDTLLGRLRRERVAGMASERTEEQAKGAVRQRSTPLALRPPPFPYFSICISRDFSIEEGYGYGEAGTGRG